jgi:phage host-nuclease inhibitor protein Gam
MATRIKATSGGTVPQSKADAMRDIKIIGDLQRELARTEADINDQIAAITNKAAPKIDSARERLVELQAGVQTWG